MHSKPLRLKVAKSSKKDPNGLVSFGMITSYIFVYNYALASFGRKCVLCWFFKQIHGIFLSHGTLHHHCKLVSFLFYHVVLFLNNVLKSSGFQKILWPGHLFTSWAWMHGSIAGGYVVVAGTTILKPQGWLRSKQNPYLHFFFSTLVLIELRN